MGEIKKQVYLLHQVPWHVLNMGIFSQVLVKVNGIFKESCAPKHRMDKSTLFAPIYCIVPFVPINFIGQVQESVSKTLEQFLHSRNKHLLYASTCEESTNRNHFEHIIKFHNTQCVKTDVGSFIRVPTFPVKLATLVSGNTYS